MLKNINTLRKGLIPYGLSDTELVIVELLYKNKNGLPIRVLSSASSIQRLTLLHSLNKLLMRNLVCKIVAHKAHIWILQKTDDQDENQQTELGIADAFAFMNKHSNAKLLGIQGSQAVVYEINNLKSEQDRLVTKQIHTSQKLKSAVVEGMVSEDILELLKNLPDDIKKSHYGRATIAHILPRGSLDSPYELLFNKKYICIASPKENKATIIHNENLSSMLTMLYSLISLQAKKINLGEIYKPD